MIVYRDIISGDEMLSDAYKLSQVLDAEGKPVEGLMYCESKIISKSDDVDVGCGNAFGTGGEEDGGADSGAVTVNNVIDGFQYTETQVGGVNDFKTWLKEYCNLVVTKMKEKNMGKEAVQGFKAQAAGIAKFLVSKFSDLQFYLGPSFDSNTMVFSIYPEGSATPNFYYIMAGFIAEKF